MFKKLYDKLFKKSIIEVPKKHTLNIIFFNIVISDDYDKKLIKKIINDNLEGYGIQYLIDTIKIDSKNKSKLVPVLYFNTEDDYNMFLMVYDSKDSFDYICNNEFYEQLGKLNYNKSIKFSLDTRKETELIKIDILKEAKKLGINCKIITDFYPLTYCYINTILFEINEDHDLIKSKLEYKMENWYNPL